MNGKGKTCKRMVAMRGKEKGKEPERMREIQETKS
jgi:hypothetical protein